MSKFLQNLLLQISMALVYSKIKLLFTKEFFPHFRPNRPSGQPAHPVFRPSHGHFFLQPATPPLPTGPQPLGRPNRSRVGGALPDCRLPRGETPHLAPPSPLSVPDWQVGPTCHHLAPAPPELGHAATASRHLRPPLNTSRCLPRAVTPPHHQPPLTPHYAASPSMAPIKGQGAPPAITTLTPALLCSLPSPQPPPHLAPTAAPVSLHCPATSPPPEPRWGPSRVPRAPLSPLCPRRWASVHRSGRRPCSGEHATALWCLRSMPPSVHGGPRAPALVHHAWTRSTKLSIEK
jgi:hypothetical protein